MIAKDHPYFFLEHLFRDSDASFRLSKYIYSPDTLFDVREQFSVEGPNLTESWVNSTLQTLDPIQELAIHSDAKIKGRTWHIPMIDLAIESPLRSDAMDRIRQFVPRAVFLSMAFFETGRSFHAYSTTLLSPKEWLDFMGRLLLTNRKDEEAIIDARWVGHRLLGGSSSLRWSNNSGLYLGSPKRVALKDLISGHQEERSTGS